MSETTTFKQSWDVLQRNAQALRNQSEPNIDDLLRIVTESVQAYKVCMSRVEAVEKALEEALQDSVDAPEKGLGGAAQTGQSSSADDADDVPRQTGK